jgi:hypothetical protein
VIGKPSIPPFEETPTQMPSPDLSKEQLEALVIDFLDQKTRVMAKVERTTMEDKPGDRSNRCNRRTKAGIH